MTVQELEPPEFDDALQGFVVHGTLVNTDGRCYRMRTLVKVDDLSPSLVVEGQDVTKRVNDVAAWQLLEQAQAWIE